MQQSAMPAASRHLLVAGARARAVVLGCVALAACAAQPAAARLGHRSTARVGDGPADREVPRGIILLIGDGMGTAHVAFVRALRGDQLQLGRIATTGLIATGSASAAVTDSAAAATAYATGVKTTNGRLSVDPAGRPRPTVVELAEARGLATGLVTTAALGDATPAAFAAHTIDRKDAVGIYAQLLDRGVDVIASSGIEGLGGGLAPSLEQLAASHGYHGARSAAELVAAASPVLAVLRTGEHDGDSPDASLPALAAWALDRLAADPDGFFVVLEHEGIDTASHHGATALLEASLRSFDDTVGVALAFAERHRGILVVALADHETGGLQLGADGLRWTTTGHTAAAVPSFAQGPGAAAFAGYRDNTEIGLALRALVERMGSQARRVEPGAAAR